MTKSFTLSRNPDWHSAAQDLVTGLQVLERNEEKIRLLELVCERLGNELYPAFLQILYTLEQHADEPSKQLVASTLINCIRSGRLPSGRLSAWGAAAGTGDKAFGQTRVLGPIEYACAWYAQGGPGQPLSQQQFSQIMNSLLNLVGSNNTAKNYYCVKLQGDIDDPMSGALSSPTRQGLLLLVQQWQTSKLTSNACNAFMNSIQSESALSKISTGPLNHIP